MLSGFPEAQNVLSDFITQETVKMVLFIEIRKLFFV